MVRRNRLQAMNDFPIVAAAVINSFHTPRDPVLHTLQSVIDKGEPLISSLSRLAGVTKGSIRALRGVKPGDDAGPVNLVLLLRALDKITPDKRPRDGNKWQLFENLLRWAEGERSRIIDSPKYSEDLATHIVAGLMAAGETQIVRWIGHNLELLDGIDDYLDYAGLWCATGAGGEVVSSAYVKSRARRTVRDALMMRYPAKEILRQVNCWHKEINNPANSLPLDTSVPDEWPALPGLPHVCGDLTIVSLTSNSQLIAEGMQLKHCVRVYTDSCWSGARHIVSIRDAAGQSLSTAELSISETADFRYDLSVDQHHSFANGMPSQACTTALADYMQSIASDEAQADLEEVCEFHQFRRGELGESGLCDDGRSASMVSNIMRKILSDYDCARDWLLDQLDIEDTWYRLDNERAAKALSKFRLDETLSDKDAFELAWDTGQWECMDAGLRPAMER